MSNFRERAKEIKAQGVAERGNFQPTGAPLNIYKFWASHTKNAPKRENFCHFWRVVAIWAPLMFLRLKATAFADSTAGQVILVLASIALLTVAGVASPSIATFLLIIAGVAAVMLGIIFLVLFIKSKWRSSWNDKVETGFLILLGVATVLVIGVAAVTLFMEFGWIILFWVVLGLAIGGVAILAIGMTAEYLAGKRAVKRQAKIKAEDAYRAEHGIYPWQVEKPSKQPGRIAKFFSGLGDFIILAAQVVRVKKWKICPMVTIEDANA